MAASLIIMRVESQRKKRSAGIQKVGFFRRDDTKAPQHFLCTKSARGRARDICIEENELIQPRPTVNTRSTTERERKREVYYATCRPGSATPEVECNLQGGRIQAKQYSQKKSMKLVDKWMSPALKANLQNLEWIDRFPTETELEFMVLDSNVWSHATP